jgi:hypothetical protein
MREADRANGEPDAAGGDGVTSGFAESGTGTSGAQPAPVGEARPPAESKETP